ncbi:MAG: AAA family ATPase [Spirochaetes bacterium]|nr:AAA family ATPase [Spirochaetota bacterium]
MNESPVSASGPPDDGESAVPAAPCEPSVIVSRLVDGMEKVIRGKRDALEKFAACFIARGHLLVEDLPGLGKTTIAKTFASLVSAGEGRSASFRRIQCTPDLLPYDITGVDVFNPDLRNFEFRPGPVFANLVLADELNRTTPKVQSALLEAMAESQVTVGRYTRRLPDFFFVVATQNPIDAEGTYPLPAAQLDRFLMRLSIGYPDAEAELSIVIDDPSRLVLGTLRPVCTIADLTGLQTAAAAVEVDVRISLAVVDTVRALRSRPELALGPSPRAALALVHAARAWALIKGRERVIGQDLADLCIPVLAHRLKPRDSRVDAARLVREETVAAVEKRRS